MLEQRSFSLKEEVRGAGDVLCSGSLRDLARVLAEGKASRRGQSGPTSRHHAGQETEDLRRAKEFFKSRGQACDNSRTGDTIVQPVKACGDRLSVRVEANPTVNSYILLT